MSTSRYYATDFLLLVSTLAFGQTTTVGSKFERGTLIKGQPTGTWEYLDETGQLELRMNYDSSRISYRRPDTARYELRIKDTWQLVRPARAPGLLGSRAGRRQALSKALRYPVAALQQQQQGDVLLSYVVQPDGSTTDYTVLSSPSPACDQEVWRVLQQLPSRWIPALYLG
jgi:protein TonB